MEKGESNGRGKEKPGELETGWYKTKIKEPRRG